MAKIHFISYGDDKFPKCKARIKKEALSCGWFDSVKIYDRPDISPAFYKEFKDILEMPRGGGYWLWKWDIILQRLNSIDPEDFLVYCDAGVLINKRGEERFREYISMLKTSTDSILAFKLSELSKKWTTKEILAAFGYHPFITEDPYQIMAGVILMKNNKKTVTIFKDCIDTLRIDPLIITDFYNNSQSSQFIDNRHDQSIFSCAIKKHGGLILPNECTFPKKPFMIHKTTRG